MLAGVTVANTQRKPFVRPAALFCDQKPTGAEAGAQKTACLALMKSWV